MRRWAAGLVLLAVISFASAQEGDFAVKVAKNPPPTQLAEPIRSLLSPESIQFSDKAGKTIAEFWLRKELPAEATPEQIKNGVTYRELKQTEILGAVRFERDWSDYRKQKVKAGVYTLRLGLQPQDGDHAGSAQFTEFVVVLDAGKDTKPALMDPKEMMEMGMKSINTGHPGVFMLFPNHKPAMAPALVSKQNEQGKHLVLNAREEISVGGKKAGAMGIGITLVGNATN